MNLLGVCSHVCLSVKSEATANMGSIELLVHGGHVSLQVVPPVRLVAALGEATLKRLILSVAVTIRWGELFPTVSIRMAWRGEKGLEV